MFLIMYFLLYWEDIGYLDIFCMILRLRDIFLSSFDDSEGLFILFKLNDKC